MKILDMHCDTISELADRGGELWENKGQLDLRRMRENGYLVQNFALFVDIGKCAPWAERSQLPGTRCERSGAEPGRRLTPREMGAPTPWERVCRLYEVYRRELEKNRDRIAPVLCYEDILQNEACGKLSALLTVEEGAVCGGSLERLRELYGMGVRMLTLTWNYPNELGWPATCRSLGRRVEDGDSGLTKKTVPEKILAAGGSGCAGENPITAAEAKGSKNGKCGSGGRDEVWGLMDAARGLTETGRDFVAEMEHLGMIPDVSHLSDAGFDAVWEVTKKPFVASHSNARAVCPSLRNLTDDRIRKLSERGGCMGLNYYDKFLVDGGSAEPEVLWEALVRQARHIVNVGGVEVLGLGSDFDGIPKNPALPGAEAMPVLWERLKTAGFTESQLDGIFWKNGMRVYRESL